MFGYGDVWLRLLSGLSQAPDSVAWASINYAPMVIGDLTSASATYRTIKGMASASWSLSGKSLKYDIIVPVGSTGTVTLDYSKITESGLPIIKGLRGVTGIKTSAGTTTITVGSGSYRFVASK
jgi:alpha-L-rhamnosidase